MIRKRLVKSSVQSGKFLRRRIESFIAKIGYDGAPGQGVSGRAQEDPKRWIDPPFLANLLLVDQRGVEVKVFGQAGNDRFEIQELIRNMHGDDPVGIEMAKV